MKVQPLLGILWFFKGRLIKAETVLEDGINGPDAINARDDHVNVWPALQRRNPDLVGLEYDEVPRGRVVFIKKSTKFRVYMDKKFHKPAIRKSILAFRLPKIRTQFLTDPHYTTDPRELERMFGREEAT